MARGAAGLVFVLARLVCACGSTTSSPDAGGTPDSGATDPCAVIECPPQQACIGGVCIQSDLCAGVTCPEEGTVCSQGSCVNGALDQDGDGSPVTDDCDDTDPAVFAGSVRPCQTACGDGLSTCASGRWQACSAPDSCDCTAGESRSEPCGNCGQARRTCGSDGVWGALGPCEAEGECVANALGVQPCPDGSDCQRQERTCDATCHWGAWSACIGDEECTPGQQESEACGCGSRARTCEASCLWSTFSECSGADECTPGTTSSRACGDCGTQTRTCNADCTWGRWPVCQEGVCLPGATESQACGACGTQTRTCGNDCNWAAWGICAGQGACAPGATRSQACGNCGTQSSTCQADCTYGAWGACFGEGACAPGASASQACGNCGTQTRQCSVTCTWDAWGACGGEGACVPGATETQACGACGTQTRTCSAACSFGAWSACADRCAAGCADGSREAFTNIDRYPDIAGCAGGWDHPGIHAWAAPICGRAAGDDGLNPNGTGCNVEDLCAEGFHVCTSAVQVATRSVDGCVGAAEAVDSFFATGQSGPGCVECATGALAGCTGVSCQANCEDNAATTNDVFGCGTRGTAIVTASCTPLDRFSGDQCASLGVPWSCPGDVLESTSLVKSGSTGGGVLCCRD